MFWVSSELNSGKKVRVFHFRGEGGVLGKLRFELRKESQSFSFSGGGRVFWVRSDLDSRNNFNVQGGVLEPNSRTGVFWRIWSKISGSLAG